MSLFGSKEECSICKINEGSKKLYDGHICKECMKKCNLFINMFSWRESSVDKINGAIAAQKENQDLTSIFSPTTIIKPYILFDDNNRLYNSPINKLIFKYDDIISYELVEDGESITRGGLGSAIAGGVLFGGVGAVVGGVAGKKKTKLEVKEFGIKIIKNNDFWPRSYINLMQGTSMKSGSLIYKGQKGIADKILAKLDMICSSKNIVEQTSNNLCPADEILKYKQLFDQGIITESEFIEKKKQLLNM